MFIKKIILFFGLSLFLYGEELILNYSYGLHTFLVEDDTHTLGLNAGLSATYQSSKNTIHNAYFEILTEYDKEDLDPDHIPVWFRANYGYSKTLAKQDNRFNLNAVYTIDWKMNTVSSIEQYLKTGVGFEFAFSEGAVTIAPMILAGAYYQEIDDDVPASNGFTRSDLEVGVKPAIMYGASASWDINKNFTLDVRLEEWNEKGTWLERYSAFKLNYEKMEEYKVIISVEKTIYNLANFRKQNVDILPWNKDTLVKLVVSMPF